MTPFSLKGTPRYCFISKPHAPHANGTVFGAPPPIESWDEWCPGVAGNGLTIAFTETTFPGDSTGINVKGYTTHPHED